MRTHPRSTRFALTALSVMAIALLAAAPTFAEDPIATSLDASEGRDFIGSWTVAMDFNGRSVEFYLIVADIDGKIGATIDSQRQPEPSAIEEIEKTDLGALRLTYAMNMGGNELTMVILAELTNEGLEGTISERSGLFSGEFTAVPSTIDPEANQQRRRNRRLGATAAKLRLGDHKYRITFSSLKTESDDFKRFGELEEGEVFEFVGGRATKLFTDSDMIFADAVVKTENMAADYPGVYSLWLRKTDEGWNLIFNEESDVWGTMHNPETDAGEIKLDVASADETQATFVVTFEESADGGLVQMAWGDTVWSAPFKVEGFTSDKATAAPALDTAQLEAIAGVWALIVDSQIGPLEQQLIIGADGAIKLSTQDEIAEVGNVRTEDGALLFDASLMGYDVTFQARLNGEKLEGDYLAGGQSVATIEGTRTGE